LDRTPETIAREIAQLHQEGRSDEALMLAQNAAERFADSPLSHANLGFLRIIAGDYAGARTSYIRALFLNPQHAEARRGLAVARRALGEEVTGDSISIVPFTGSGTAPDILVLLTLGDGNVAFETLFDPSLVRMTKLAVELHAPNAGLPPHDLIFNAVGEADSSQRALGMARVLAAQTTRPVLNAPSRVASTGRIEQAQRLRAVPGVRIPEIRRIVRAELEWADLPLLVRSPGYHAGKHFERLENEADRAAALTSLPAGDLFAIAFVDTRDEAGVFAKYRVVAVDGRLYPVHLAISHGWKVHYFSAEMAQNPAYREREARFLENPRDALPAGAWERLETIAARTGLEYAGIDFSFDREGALVVFECNATMAIRFPPKEPMWGYRRPAIEAIMGAMQAMAERYSST
jgi:hypothetical protein